MADCKNQNIEWYSSKMLEENNGDLGSSHETLNKLKLCLVKEAPVQ